MTREGERRGRVRSTRRVTDDNERKERRYRRGRDIRYRSWDELVTVHPPQGRGPLRQVYGK
jgi:hypothetical protein